MDKKLTPESGVEIANQGIEDLQKYQLRTNREILYLLRALAAKPDLLNARIPDSRDAAITAVLDVLPKRNLVVFDYGPDEKLNERLLEAERVVFTARHDLVDTRFSCTGLKRVKYNGGPAFAAAIPDTIVYLQRREYFRVKPLISHPVFCRVNRAEHPELKLKALDLCVRGISLQDNESLLQVVPGDRIENCKLLLPANPVLSVDLEIRYLTNVVLQERQTTRVGAGFINLQQSDEFTLQRFINMVQMEQNALARG